MNKISYLIIGLISGLIIGFFGANYLNKNAPSAKQQTVPNQQVPTNINPNTQSPQTGGMLADVQKTIDKAKNEPENFDAQIKAGEMYARIKKYDVALEFFQKAQRLKPNDFDANARLGNAFFDARQFENAETYYLKALEIKPKDETIRSDLATTFVQRNQPDYERALQEFNKVLEINPKHEPTIYNMAIAYLRKGEKENANKMLEKLKEANSESDLIKRLEEIINKN